MLATTSVTTPTSSATSAALQKEHKNLSNLSLNEIKENEEVNEFYKNDSSPGKKDVKAGKFESPLLTRTQCTTVSFHRDRL